MNEKVFEFLCNMGMFFVIVSIILISYVAFERMDKAYEREEDDEIEK